MTATGRLRTEQGAFDVLYRDTTLVELVGAIARYVAPEAPLEISQPVFNRGRKDAGDGLGYPDPPSASAVYQRINSRLNRRLSWREIVRLGVEATSPVDAR